MAMMAMQRRGPDWTEMTRKTMRKVILSRQIERKIRFVNVEISARKPK